MQIQARRLQFDSKTVSAFCIIHVHYTLYITVLRYEGIAAYFDADNLQVCGILLAPYLASFFTLIYQVTSFYALFLLDVSHKTISKEKLKEGVESSCCLLLVLNDEVTNTCNFYSLDLKLISPSY